MVNDGGLSDHENGHKSIAEQGANALDKSLPGTKATVTGSSVPDARTKADTLVDKDVFELPNWSTQSPDRDSNVDRVQVDSAGDLR